MSANGKDSDGELSAYEMWLEERADWDPATEMWDSLRTTMDSSRRRRSTARMAGDAPSARITFLAATMSRKDAFTAARSGPLVLKSNRSDRAPFLLRVSARNSGKCEISRYVGHVPA